MENESNTFQCHEPGNGVIEMSQLQFNMNSV